jgi:hypothetical protein
MSLTSSDKLTLWLVVAVFGLFVSGARAIRAERQGRRTEAWIAFTWFAVWSLLTDACLLELLSW